jgi:1-acyl-sn-glycerol-3-phosphate acyltransferase
MTNAHESELASAWSPIPDDRRGVSLPRNLLRLAAGVLVLAVFTLPMLTFLRIAGDAAWIRNRWLRAGARLELFLLGVSLEVEGAERLDRAGPFIMMSNHGSLLDVLVFGSLLRRPARALLRQEFARIPLLGPVLRRAGHILFDRQSPRAAARALDDAATALAAGDAILVFPEGTRHPHGTLGPFRAGAFRLAVRTRAPVVPITVLNAAALLPPGTRALRSGVVRVVVGAPIDTTRWTRDLDEHVREVRAAIARPLAAYRAQLGFRT